MDLSQDFREFIELLNKNRVRYLVIGGYAVTLHGFPRYTKDLDVWVEATPENATRVLDVLRSFGFGSLDLQERDFTKPDRIIQLGYPPNRIDLLTTPSGVDFKTCYAVRKQIQLSGVKVNFIDLENLKRNKQAAGRTQDRLDLENLEKRAVPRSKKPVTRKTKKPKTTKPNT